MKTNVNDYTSLLLEKQRLKLLCATQEKEMSDNLVILKEKLNPSLLMREAILEIIPREVRENKIVSFIGSFVGGSKNKTEGGMSGDIANILKTTFLSFALKFIDNYLNKDANA
jgi:hypothetical protein